MNARGYAIAAVLLIGSVVMTVAIRVSSHSMGNSKSATSQLNRLRAREASLSGIEIGRWLLEKTPRETDGDTDENGHARSKRSLETFMFRSGCRTNRPVSTLQSWFTSPES